MIATAAALTFRSSAAPEAADELPQQPQNEAQAPSTAAAAVPVAMLANDADAVITPAAQQASPSEIDEWARIASLTDLWLPNLRKQYDPAVPPLPLETLVAPTGAMPQEGGAMAVRAQERIAKEGAAVVAAILGDSVTRTPAVPEAARAGARVKRRRRNQTRPVAVLLCLAAIGVPAAALLMQPTTGKIADSPLAAMEAFARIPAELPPGGEAPAPRAADTAPATILSPRPVPEVGATPIIGTEATAETASSPRLSQAEIAALVTRGDAFFGMADIASARLFYERAADAGDGQAALRLGETFDPVFLDRADLHGVRGDPGAALSWYRRARDLGAVEAEILLKGLDLK